MATSGDEIMNTSSTPESESNELFCSPCQSDGKRQAAVGYCETCKASLCKLCFDCHTVPMPMRNHRLLKTDQTAVEHDVSKETSQCCPKHEKEEVMYHCPTHSFLGCHICFFQHQKTCRDVKYIPDIAETFDISDNFKEFMAKLRHTTETSKDLEDEYKRNITLVEQCRADAIAAIKAFKLELLETIDQLERDLLAKAETFTQEGISELKSAVDKCLQYQTEIETIATEMETLQNKNRKNELYIAMVKSQNKLLSLETELNEAKGGNQVKCFKFDANAETQQILKGSVWLGKLRILSDSVKADHIEDINVKRQGDKNTCIITGSIVMQDHRLVIADYQNKNVKVIDTKQQKVLSAITLTSDPRSLAKVADDRVVATLPDEKKIVFIRINPALGIDTDIRVKGACYGVAYSDGKLVVSFTRPHKVEIMDVKGSVLRTIQTDCNGHDLFNSPNYVAINPGCSLIFVSNHWSHNVVCLRFDGTVVATYKDNELQHPRQVIVDSTGNVYVCASGSKNVHQITEDCKKSKVILTSADGLSNPYTISYEETEGKLYVGQWGNDNVKVYQVTKEYTCRT